MTTLARTKSTDCHPVYTLTGPSGELSYDSHRAELSADGDLPPWIVASGYATDCDVALNDHFDGGGEALWTYMEMLYRQAEGRR